MGRHVASGIVGGEARPCCSGCCQGSGICCGGNVCSAACCGGEQAEQEQAPACCCRRQTSALRTLHSVCAQATCWNRCAASQFGACRHHLPPSTENSSPDWTSFGTHPWIFRHRRQLARDLHECQCSIASPSSAQVAMPSAWVSLHSKRGAGQRVGRCVE